VPSHPPKISIVIPCRRTGNPYVTLKSLGAQTYQDFEVIVSWDVDDKGANYARNRGSEKARGQYLLFSDDDIDWNPLALEWLMAALEANPTKAYSYGAYDGHGGVQCNREWDADALRVNNYISTMSLIRKEVFPGFDESIRRLQDWDLWLTLLEQGLGGVYCGGLIFVTKPRPNGITYGDSISYADAERLVKEKHGLNA